MFKKIVNAVAYVFALLFVVAIIIAITSPKQPSTYVQPGTVIEPLQGPNLPVQKPFVEQRDWMKDSYIESCNSDGKIYAYCDCSYNFLENRLGQTGIMELGAQYLKDGKYTQDMLDAASSCIHLYNK